MNWNRLWADLRVRAAVVLAVAVGLPALFAQTSLYDQIRRWGYDWHQRVLGGSSGFGDVLIVDVDDESVRRLAPPGAGRITRQTLAEAEALLLRAGARAIAYQLPLTGGGMAGTELAREPLARVVFGAVGVPTLRDGDASAAPERIAPLSLPIGSHVPRREWAGVKLPVDATTRPGAGRVGVVNLPSEHDGVVRRIPLLHGVGENTLPSLPLAAMLVGDPRNLLEVDPDELRLGALRIPITDAGEALVRFPSNVGALPTLPLHRVVAARDAGGGASDLEDRVKGRTVFLGRTVPPMATYVRTPVGILPEVAVSALGFSLVSRGNLLAPAPAWMNATLVLFMLLLPLSLLVRGAAARGAHFLVSAAAIPLGAFAVGTALFAMGIDAAWLFALMVGAVGFAMVSTMWLGTIHENTRRLEIETRAVEEASRLKTEFLNQLAHELRTPLTAIMGFNKVNQFTDDLGKEVRIKNAEIIGRNCEHLLILINNQLDLARISAGTLEIAPAAEDPEQICRDAVATVRAFAEEKRLRLRFIKRTPLPPALMLDAFRVRQILINLLGNAVKFTQQGSVELAVSWHIAAIEIEVSDTGPGILSEAFERIFEPYQQGDATIASRFGGTGLGLAITRRLVEMMGGTIEVESKVGVGTTFRVRLPSESVARRPAAEPESFATARAPLVGRVLLAEDNDDIRALIEHHLARLGIDATAVANGFSAVDAALAAPYDVVLMDMEMPVMNGYEAVHVLRERGYRGTIFALTAHHGGEEAQRALAAGCDGLVTKPVTLETLRAALQPLLPGAPRKAAAG